MVLETVIRIKHFMRVVLVSDFIVIRESIAIFQETRQPLNAQRRNFSLYVSLEVHQK